MIDLVYKTSGVYVSKSTEATQAVGRMLGSLLVPGTTLVLTGDLGAGKTQLTKGIADVLGVTSDIVSPTFTIQIIHETPLCPLYHFDLYRIEDADQLGDCGLWDALEDDAICIIEWGEAFADEIGEDRIDITIHRNDAEAELGVEPTRIIAVCGYTDSAKSLIARLDECIRAESD